METLFIKPDPASDHAEWVVMDAAGNPHAAIRQGPLSQIRDFARQRRIVCIIPGEEVYLAQAILPAQRNRSRYQQAIPYALEDDLAEDPDDLHFALGKEQALHSQNEGGAETAARQVAIPVAVINKNYLRNWLQKLEQAGLKPHVIAPEILSLPWEDSNGWNIMLDRNLALVRTHPLQGFVCDPENLESLLNAAIDSSENKPNQIRIWNYNGAAASPDLKSEISIEHISPEHAALTTLAKSYRQENSINLLQGEFSFREEYGKLLRPWRTPLILLGALIGVLFLANIAEYLQLKSKADDLQQQLVATYMDAFPNAMNVPEPRMQMETKLKELAGTATGDNHFLQLLDIAATEISKVSSVKITSLNFNNNDLDLELALPDVQVLDVLKQQLDQYPELQTDIQSASAEGEQINGRLRISKQ